MRKVLTILCVLLFTLPLVAQQRTGNITGQVFDTQGNALPGVTVILTGATLRPLTAITSADGVFRFLSLFPAKDYAVKCELEGFKTRTESGIIIVVGETTALRVTMEMGALEEEITVTAVSPVIDTKKTSITQTVNYEALQSLPSARDPWVVLQMTPSVQVDRENIGGSDSGQQSTYVAKGGNRYNSIWTMDGVVITDPAARGASPTYFDFDIFEEMNVTVGGADVETQTGGVALNLVSRRGGNKINFGGRFYYTDEKFQSTPPDNEDTRELKVIFGEDAGYNRIRDIKDYGFNVGGPLWQDKAWWWGSYGIQEIKTNIINGSIDDTYLTNFAGKINLQIIPENRFELFIHAGKKEKFGRDSSTSLPLGRNQKGKYHFGSPIIKIQDEHMFGDNFFVSAKYGFTDAGFGLWPAEDPELSELRWYDQTARVHRRSYSWFFSGRPNKQYTLHGTYFNDDLLGASHEFKAGVEYVDRRNEYVSGNPGNMRIWYNYNSPTVDMSGILASDGDTSRDITLDEFGIDMRLVRLYRGTTFGQNLTYGYVGFLQDTISFGRFSLKLGVRFDKQHPEWGGFEGDTIFTQDSDDPNLKNYLETQQRYLGAGVGEKLLALFPGVTIPAEDKTSDWDFWSPRFGMTWDVTGDGKTIAKLAGGIYGGYMGTWGYMWAKQGGGGRFDFWWWDKNNDEVMDMSEMYWANYTKSRTAYNAFDANGNFVGDWDAAKNYMWAGYNPDDPAVLDPPRREFDPNWGPDRTYELLFTLEREILPDLGVALDVTWRRYNNWGWDRRYTDVARGTLESRSDYIAAGTVPTTVTDPKTGTTYSTDEAGGRTWYVWGAHVKDIYERYRQNTPSDYYDQYLGLDIRFNKRLSNRWMLNGSFTFQDQRTYWGKEYPLNDTNRWASDGKPYAYEIGGASGKLSQPVFSVWMFKAQGLYQAPYDINVSFSFNARQGHVNPHEFGLADYNLPNPADQSVTLVTAEYAKYRLPSFYNLNFRLEKVLRVGDAGRIYIMMDIFNALNSSILNRQRDTNPGTYYVHSGAFSVNTQSGEPNEVLNPRVFRLGVRFQF